MNRELCFVFDTNVLVSALMFAQSIPRQAWNRARQTGVVLASADTLAELRSVVGRPKILAYVSHAESAAFIAEVVHQAKVIEITERIQHCTDPKDDMFLELALAGRADYLVSGDRSHLQILGSFRGTRIISPRQLLDLI